MNEADQIWVGAVRKDGKITKKPLLFVKKLKSFQSEVIDPDWSFLNSLPIWPGMQYPSNLECVYFSSYRREDVCAFICGAEAAYCITFHNLKSFFGSNSGEYSRNSGIGYEMIMKPEVLVSQEPEDE